MSRLNLFITSTTEGFRSLQKLDSEITLIEMKEKFEMVTGISAGNQKLQIYDLNDKLVREMTDNKSTLEQNGVQENFRIHVTPLSADSLGNAIGNVGAAIVDYNDTSKVEKYEMDEDEYDQMKGTVRDFKRKMKMGRFNEEEQKRKAEMEECRRKCMEKKQNEAIKNLSIGSRCQVTVPNAAKRLGQVMFLGKTEFAEGLWAGIQYDEPVGKNDGSVKGKRYFQCKDKYGGFAKVEYVECGDFPAEDLLNSDDLMSSEDEI